MKEKLEEVENALRREQSAYAQVQVKYFYSREHLYHCPLTTDIAKKTFYITHHLALLETTYFTSKPILLSQNIDIKN